VPGDKLLLQLERRTEETYFTCFTSTKVQILTPAEPPRRQAVAAARAAHRGVAGRLFPAAHCKHLVGACALRPCDGGAGNGADGAAGRGAVAGGCDSKRPAGISYISVYLLYWYLSTRYLRVGLRCSHSQQLSKASIPPGRCTGIYLVLLVSTRRYLSSISVSLLSWYLSVLVSPHACFTVCYTALICNDAQCAGHFRCQY
jgi:hypothetical protein